MNDPFGFGPVPQAGESSKEKNVCAFCDSEMTVSSKFIKIDEEKRIGDVPLVLSNIKHPEAQFVCLDHWLQNKQLFEKKFGRDSFEGNPGVRDASIEIAQSMMDKVSGENQDNDKSKPQDTTVDQDATMDETDSISRIAELQRDSLMLATAALPSGMFVGVKATSSAVNGLSDGTGLDFNKLSPLFLRFLAWQRLNQVNQQIHILNGMTSQQRTAIAEMEASIIRSNQTKPKEREWEKSRVTMDDVKASFDLSKTISEPEKTVSEPERKRPRSGTKHRDSTEMNDGESEHATVKSVAEKKSESDRKSLDIDTNRVEKEVVGVEEQIRRVMENREKQLHFIRAVSQDETHYARLLSFHPLINIAILDKVPLVCGREKGPDSVPNFLEIGDLTLHKRAVSRKHFTITYDKDIKTFFIEVTSRNGIILDGRDYHDGRHPLHNGASISVQHFTMYFDVPTGFMPPAECSSSQ